VKEAKDAHGQPLRVGDTVRVAGRAGLLGEVTHVEEVGGQARVYFAVAGTSIAASAAAREVQQVARLRSPVATGQSPVTDVFGRRVVDGSAVQGSDGRRGVVVMALGVPEGPWLRGRVASTLGGLVVDWQDGSRSFTKARTVTVVRAVAEAAR
jgi:hypothetical protein